MRVIQDTAIQTVFRIVDEEGNVHQELPLQPIKVLLNPQSISGAMQTILQKKAEVQADVDRQVAAQSEAPGNDNVIPLNRAQRRAAAKKKVAPTVAPVASE